MRFLFFIPIDEMRYNNVKVALVLFGMFFAAEMTSALPALKPEAEARGEKSPVELVLRLHKCRIKPNESIWGQIELKNIGKQDIAVTNDLFFKSWPIEDRSERPNGVFVEVTDATGKPVRPRPGAYDFEANPTARKLSDVDTKKDREISHLVDEWKKAGLSREAIDEKLESYDREQGLNFREKERAEWKTTLKPGESRISRPWAHRDRNPSDAEPSTLPLGQFSELKYYFVPGKYAIRAVYDRRLSERLKKVMAADDMNILVKTKPISIEVMR